MPKEIKLSKTKALSERYYNGSQSVCYKGIYLMAGKKLQVLIEKDSLDRQSSSGVFLFDEAKNSWNRLSYIPYSQMQVVKGEVFCYRKVQEDGKGLLGHEFQAFKMDIRTLLEEAKLVLF